MVYEPSISYSAPMHGPPLISYPNILSSTVSFSPTGGFKSYLACIAMKLRYVCAFWTCLVATFFLSVSAVARPGSASDRSAQSPAGQAGCGAVALVLDDIESTGQIECDIHRSIELPYDSTEIVLGQVRAACLQVTALAVAPRRR